MKRISVLFYLLILIKVSSAQSLLLSKIDSITNTYFLDTQTIIKTLDGGYAIPFEGNGLIKLDSLAQIQWIKYYYYDATYALPLVFQRNDSTLIFVSQEGPTFLFQMDGWDALLINPHDGSIIGYGPGVPRFTYDGGSIGRVVHDKTTDQIYIIGHNYGINPTTENTNKNDVYLLKYNNNFGLLSGIGNNYFNNPTPNLMSFYDVYPICNNNNPGQYLIFSAPHSLIKKSNLGSTLWQKSFTRYDPPYLSFSNNGEIFLIRSLNNMFVSSSIHKIDSSGNTIFNMAFDSIRILSASYNHSNSYLFIGKKQRQTIIFETDSNINIVRSKKVDHLYLNNLAGLCYAQLIDTVDDSFTFFYKNFNLYNPMYVEKIDFNNICESDTFPINTYPIPITDTLTNLIHISYGVGVGNTWGEQAVNGLSQLIPCPVLGLPESINNTGFKVYPNPITTSLNISLPDYSKPVDATIMDITGRSIINCHITSPQSEIKLKDKVKGVCFIEIEGMVKKIIIQ